LVAEIVDPSLKADSAVRDGLEQQETSDPRILGSVVMAEYEAESPSQVCQAIPSVFFETVPRSARYLQVVEPEAGQAPCPVFLCRSPKRGAVERAVMYYGCIF
jgi:hypothetical protein